MVEVRRDGANTALARVQTHGGEQRTLTLAPRELAKPAAVADRGARAETGRERRGVAQLWFWLATGALDAFKSRRMIANILWGVTAATGAGTTVRSFFTDFGRGGREREGQQQARAYGVGVRGTF